MNFPMVCAGEISHLFRLKKVGILQIFIEWWNLKIFPVIHQYQGGFSGEIWWNLVKSGEIWWNLVKSLPMFSQVIQVALILGQVRRGLPRSLCCLSLPMSFEARCVVFGSYNKNIDMDMLCIYIYMSILYILYLSNALSSAGHFQMPKRCV